MKPFSKFLLEMFDNPRHLTPIEKGHPLHTAIQRSVVEISPDANHLKAFLIDDGKEGILVEFATNGAVEVHHTDEKGMGGYMNPAALSANPRFISTMLSRIKHHVIDRQHPVRVVGTGRQFEHYHRITKRLVGKYGAEVGEPMPYAHQLLPHTEVKQFIIKSPQTSMTTLPENIQLGE